MIKLVEQTPERSFTMDATFSRQCERSYFVYSDFEDDEAYVGLGLATFGLGIGVAQPYDPQQRCVGLSLTSMGRCACPTDNSDATMWGLTLSFGPWNPMELSFDGDPTAIPPIFRFDLDVLNVPCLVDVDGDPIVNSAGDYYDPPVEREASRVTLTVNRNEASPNVATLLALDYVVNLAAWNGFPPKTVRLACPKLPQVQYCQATGSFYWPMEYVFNVNFDTWVKQVLNRGFRQLDSDGNLVPIYVNGQPLSDPVFLDAEGHAILTPDYLDASGDTPGESSSAGYSGEVAGGGQPPQAGTSSEGGSVYPNAYDVYRTFDFSQFNLNNLFTLPSVL